MRGRLVGSTRAMSFGTRAVAGVALGVGREAWAVGAALATYRNRFEMPTRPRTMRPTWETEPVVLVHGLGHNAGAWSTLGSRLAAAGFFELCPVTYALDAKVSQIAARIADQVEENVTSSSVECVHLVGHSLGGVAIRYWYDVLGG